MRQWAGRVSYPLYLLHNHIGCTLVFVYAVSPFGTIGAVVLAAFSVILIAASVNQFLERPLTAALRQFTGANKTPPAGDEFVSRAGYRVERSAAG